MEDVARVILGLGEHDVAEEVMHFLDRSGRARVVATAGDGRQLAEAVRQLEPDVVVAQPSVAAGAAWDGGALLVLDTRESVASLRAAIAAGARGYYVWPGEREALAGAAADARTLPAARERRAHVVAVHGPRGGAGATFVATHLAAAFARRGLRTAVVDLDLCFGDLDAVLGAGDGARTFADLAPIAMEAALADAAWTHPEGFRAVFAPPPEDEVDPRDAQSVAAALAAEEEVVVLHLPRAPDGLARWAFGFADRVIEVLALDVLSFRAATRALARPGRRRARGVRGQPQRSCGDRPGRRASCLRPRPAGGPADRPRRGRRTGPRPAASPPRPDGARVRPARAAVRERGLRGCRSDLTCDR